LSSKEQLLEAGLNALELVLRGWQAKGATIAIACVGSGMRVVFSGRIREPRVGTWIIGNGRAGVSFDMRHATGSLADPTAIPDLVRGCVGTEFTTVMELLLETGDECWLGEMR
jgi:hypothetical protein